MLSQQWLQDRLSLGLHSCQRTDLVTFDEPAIADNMRSEDDGEPALGTIFGH